MTVEEGEFGKLALPHNAEELLEQLRQDVSDINDGAGALTLADTTDTTTWVVLAEDQTGTLAPKSDGGLTYNAGTGTLTATAFAGPLTGNVTGTASVATTVTVADTGSASAYIGLFESATGNLGAKSDPGARYDASSGRATFTGGIVLSGSSPGNTALTHYEQSGTWTPTLAYDTPGTSSFTYGTQVGRFSRIGNIVHFNCRIILTNYSLGTGTGNLNITGLPYASANVANSYFTFPVFYSNVTIPTNGLSAVGRLINNASSIQIFSNLATGVNLVWDPASAGFALSTTSVIQLSGHYLV
jgi:hypothetical protein